MRALPALGLVLLVLAGCAADPNPVAAPLNEAGFYLGVWHGIISPVTLIISLFTNFVGMYEVRNTGWPYDLGFALGGGILFGGIWRST